MYRIFAFWLSLVFLFLWIACCQSTPEHVCLAESVIKISLKSLRNQNGNWVTKVGLDRGGAQNMTSVIDADLWEIDVEANTKYCYGVGSSLTYFLALTAPLNIRSEPNVSSEPIVRFKPNVRSDYELFPGVGYYKFHTDITTWPRARQICADENAHLLIINSERESQVAITLFGRHPSIAGASHNNYAWIGVERKNGKYWTIFGDSLNSTGFVKWGWNQPNEGDEDCLLVERWAGDLWDRICDWKVAFICEHEL